MQGVTGTLTMSAEKMSAADFTAWTKKSGLRGDQIADLFGTSPQTVARWCRQGAPRHVALACAALATGLAPWHRRATSCQRDALAPVSSRPAGVSSGHGTSP